MGVSYLLTALLTSISPPYIHGALKNQYVQINPSIYVVAWGSQWVGNDPYHTVQLLTDFYSRVQGSDWYRPVMEYCSGAKNCQRGGQHPYDTVTLRGVWYNTDRPAPGSVNHYDIAVEAIIAAHHFGGGVGKDTQIVVLTPPGVGSDGFGTEWCAWHSATESPFGPLPFVYLPYNLDYPNTCGSGWLGSPTDGVTIVAGHELVETITEPFINAGWENRYGQEIGDLCSWRWTGPGAIASRTFGDLNFTVGGYWNLNLRDCH